jgi:hypothetical protein
LVDLTVFDSEKLPLPPYISDKLWAEVVRVLDSKPKPAPEKRKRGRPPIHGYYCQNTPSITELLPVDTFCSSGGKSLHMRELLREAQYDHIKKKNKEAAKRCRERKVRLLQMLGKYRQPGRPLPDGRRSCVQVHK